MIRLRLALATICVACQLAAALALAAAAGCAVAVHPGDELGDAGGTTPTDAALTADAPSHATDAPTEAADAHVADGPAQPVTVTLSQTSTATLATSSLGCGGADNTTSEQAYYRVFDIAAMGVIGPLSLSSIAFGVQSDDGSQTITVNVGTYSAAPGTTLDVGSSDGDDWAAGDVTAIASTTKALTSSAAGTIVSVPITATIPANARLIVEIRSPDDTAKTNSEFFLAASAGSETTPGFFWAPDCATAPPTTPVGLAQPVTPFQITATGSYTP